MLILKNHIFPFSCIALKVSNYGVISGPYFPVFGLNTEIYRVFGQFLRSDRYNNLLYEKVR